MRERILGVIKAWFESQGGDGGPYVAIGNNYSELDGGFDLNDLAEHLAREVGKG